MLFTFCRPSLKGMLPSPSLAHSPAEKMPCLSDAASGPAVAATAADAGDVDWAESEDDGADDEATLDADEQAAAAEGVNIKARLGT